MILDLLKSIKKFLKPYAGKYLGFYFYGRFSYAQEGEDLVVQRLVPGARKGFYVEVGCHHPFRFSNTYLFYKNGWRGICIDPLPGTKKMFNRFRPRDITLEMGVNEQAGHLTYYMFNEPALNTFDASVARDRNGSKDYRITGEKLVEVKRLGDILSGFNDLPAIDILSVDVEGLDLQVLKSNDWDRFRPRIIIAECLSLEIENISSDAVYNYLVALNYSIYAKTGHSVVFISNK